MNSDSENVLKALSSSTRRTIMRQISDKGSATYTEIMQVLGLDPNLMSGTFNYHLKELSEVGLIERTNGEYRISDLGKRALILVDQVAKDVKIDQYGVLSAVMSMSPRKELALFTSQMGMMAGMIFTILSLIPFLIDFNAASPFIWISSAFFMISLGIAVGSTAKMIGILRKFKVGFSIMVFLSSNWFFIRSPNRNRFFIITMLTVASIITGALGILLAFSGEIAWFSMWWYQLVVPSITTGILTIWLYIRTRRRAHQLEEKQNEQ
ncbi:MAG: winged helix-turn-helix domain-containing protein [Candidatus Thorarchaeota archaeon]